MMWKQKSLVVFSIGLGIGIILWIQMGMYVAHVLFNLQVSANIFKFCVSLFKEKTFLYSLALLLINGFITYSFFVILLKIRKQMILSKKIREKFSLQTNEKLTDEWNKRLNRMHNDILVIQSKEPLAFTLGFQKPIIILSTALIEMLDRVEVEAVIYHEIAHQKNYDAIKIFVLEIITNVIWYVPLTKWSYQNYKIMCELAADEYAISRMGSEIGIGSALIKLIKTHLNPNSNRVMVSFTDGSIDFRLKQLIEPQKSIPVKLQIKSIIISVYVQLLIMIALLIAVY